MRAFGCNSSSADETTGPTISPLTSRCATRTSPSTRACSEMTSMLTSSASAITSPLTMPSMRSPPLKCTSPVIVVVAPIRLSMVLLAFLPNMMNSLQVFRLLRAHCTTLEDLDLHGFDDRVGRHVQHTLDALIMLE